MFYKLLSTPLSFFTLSPPPVWHRQITKHLLRVFFKEEIERIISYETGNSDNFVLCLIRRVGVGLSSGPVTPGKQFA